MLKIVVLVIGVGDQDKHKLEDIAIPSAMKQRLKRGTSIWTNPQNLCFLLR